MMLHSSPLAKSSVAYNTSDSTGTGSEGEGAARDSSSSGPSDDCLLPSSNSPTLPQPTITTASSAPMPASRRSFHIPRASWQVMEQVTTRTTDWGNCTKPPPPPATTASSAPMLASSRSFHIPRASWQVMEQVTTRTTDWGNCTKPPPPPATTASSAPMLASSRSFHIPRASWQVMEQVTTRTTDWGNCTKPRPPPATSAPVAAAATASAEELTPGSPQQSQWPVSVHSQSDQQCNGSQNINDDCLRLQRDKVRSIVAKEVANRDDRHQGYAGAQVTSCRGEWSYVGTELEEEHGKEPNRSSENSYDEELKRGRVKKMKSNNNSSSQHNFQHKSNSFQHLSQ
ncbi:mucin-5AC-like isoform X1 [Schistocerca nitens]|uniref:mucin-5AC-like isoform X1 n=2 Tax=Schistocerca nitens TaxID=7011 RepID=UPI002118A2A1|nr:mucin-5AC-like isoform X1 [Schistocerca nitens]